MPSEAPNAPHAEPPKGLPPVAAPSGKFIAQLFFVPLLIVLVLVIAFFGIPWLFGVGFGGSASPEKYLQNLKDANPDIRWRAADDLAQLLQKDLARDGKWSSDPKLALDLAEQLQKAVEDFEHTEKGIQEALRKLAVIKDSDRERTEHLRRLEKERSYLEYLTACVGNLLVPTAVPLLSEMALKPGGVSDEAIALRRRQAVWALVNLGRNLERFDGLSEARKDEVAAQLEQEAEAAAGRARADWAKQAREYLVARREKQLQVLGLDVTLARCALEPNPELRKMTALALMYWEGGPVENARMEETLLRLAHDDGFGAQENQSMRGREVRYHAALALARRGSDKIPFDLLQEMLNEEVLLQNLRTKTDAGQDVPDRSAVYATMSNALTVFAELRRRQPDRDLSVLYTALRQLKQSKEAAVRVEAERTLKLIGGS